MDIFNEVFKDCTSAELRNFMKEYDLYIQNFYENHDNSCVPVCMAEFYENDY